MNIAGVAVTVTDDDTAGVTVSASTLTVPRAAAQPTRWLNTQPTSDVVISVTRTGSTDVTVSPATLTFTSSNWDTAQTVTVRAAQDADAVNDAASIAHAVVAASSANEYDNVNIAGVAVTVTDDDTAGATVSETTLTVAEGGSGSYTVRLNTQPASDVVISVTKTGSTDVTVSPARLTFTRANWDTAQTVTVRRPGRRRGERHGLHRPRGGGRQQRRRVRRREHRRGGRDRHRRRHRRGDGVRDHADGCRGRQRNLHGG